MVSIRLARDSTTTSLGMDFDKRNTVTRVAIDGLAHKAGLQKGDVITKVDGKDVGESMNLFYRRAIEEAPVVNLSVRRGHAFDRQVTFTQRRNSVDL